MNEAQARLENLEDRQKDSESRLRAVEAAVIQLTEISRQLKEAAADRETRIRRLEADANLKSEYHDEDHEDRLKRLENMMAATKEASAKQGSITANLSVREIILLLAALFGLITGKFDWITSIFK